MTDFYKQLSVVRQRYDEQIQADGDLISRTELLKALETWDRFGVDDTNSLFRLDNLSLPHYVAYIHYDDVVKCIKGMPSVKADGECIKKSDVLDALEVSYLKSEIDDDTYQRIRDMPFVAIPTEHDGCKDCKHENKSDGEYPCSYCKQNYKDMWEREKPTDTITMTREEFSEKLMEHYRQGRADEKAYQNGEIMQSFNPD